MKIKEFFKDCSYCNHVHINLWSVDEFDKYHHIDKCEIYGLKDIHDFVDVYENEEILGWQVENSEGDTEITFYFKG